MPSSGLSGDSSPSARGARGPARANKHHPPLVPGDKKCSLFINKKKNPNDSRTVLIYADIIGNLGH